MKNIFLAFTLLILASCSSKSYPDSKWGNKQWTLIEIMGVPVQTSGSVQDAHLVFDADDQQITGSGSCNRIFGPYEIGKKNTLKFGEIGATRIACQNSAFENTFLETLKSVRYFQQTGGQLLLKNGEKKVILKLQ
ncbi:Heat shock protein HslJ [Algoriphagus locisalis]|uniref:Heat shock protein HslJ n=1 Tax=Algoriphagus locisalis TaxID=305507 RepID=A0A1I7DCW6_9BACT|nr:META domain-containing protein [Algoriphagus locisalis]SFU09573.1 Heat shock protein HslJ [Algoriphagus locisalis]